jgi:hypothetical protein
MLLFSVFGDTSSRLGWREDTKIEIERKNLKDYGQLTAPMAPNTVRHPRGRHIPEKQEKLKKNKQGEMERLVRKYTNGAINEPEFRKELRNKGVEIDTQFDKLIAKHESGNFIGHKEFGKEVLRRTIQPADYNRVNKISLQLPTQTVEVDDKVIPVKEINKDFNDEKAKPKPHTRFIHENYGVRDIYNKKVYVEKKGKSKIDVQEQISSSEPNLTKWDKTETEYALHGETFKPAKTIINNERDHHKLYRYI